MDQGLGVGEAPLPAAARWVVSVAVPARAGIA